jgi:hypothetical protein
MASNENDSNSVNQSENWENAQKRGKILGGLAVLAAGGLLLARELGYDLAWWLFTWKFWIIIIGVVIGVKHNFRRIFWIFPVLVGSVYLLVDFYPGLVNRAILWPVVLMVFGVLMVFRAFRPRKHNYCRNDSKRHFRKSDWTQDSDMKVVTGPPLEDSTFEVVSVLGGVNKKVVTKYLRFGEITAVMAGVELNFLSAEIQSTAHIEVNAVMGGIQIILPSNWDIKSEINCVMGGVDDKRHFRPAEGEDKKLLILEGNVFMGGIEINNF